MLQKRSFKKIYKNYLEFFAADHCVLKCWQCANFSNVNYPKIAKLATFCKDLKTLAKIMHVETLRFCGGEPLLNNEIVKFIKVAREINFAYTIGLCTNGILLKDVDDELFSQIDYLNVSLYPLSNYRNLKIERDSIIKIAKIKRKKYKFFLKFFEFYCFKPWRYSYVDLPINNSPLVKRIYAACGRAKNCHTIYDGYYYKCAMPIYLRRYLINMQISSKNILNYEKIDGVPLHQPDLYNRLITYLNSDVPLKACNYCLGTSGKNMRIKQVSMKELKDSKTKKINMIEDLLDISKLRESEKNASVARSRSLKQMGILKKINKGIDKDALIRTVGLRDVDSF